MYNLFCHICREPFPGLIPSLALWVLIIWALTGCAYTSFDDPNYDWDRRLVPMQHWKPEPAISWCPVNYYV